MNNETCRTKKMPQMVVEETFYKTKRFFLKTFRNIKSFLSRGYQKIPRNPFTNPIFSGGHKTGPKLQRKDDFYRNFTRSWDSGEAVDKEQREGDGQCSKSSMSVSDQSRLEDLKGEKKAKIYSGGKVEQQSFLATENFAQKMEELEMKDANNGDHVLDIDEVIHQYSLLTSPVYLDIVDKFFMDVYLELYLPKPSKRGNGLIRKPGSACIHGSMRKTDSASIHSSMTKMDLASVHGSMRKAGSASVHGSMRKVGSASVPGSMRKLGSDSVHSSARNLGPLKI